VKERTKRFYNNVNSEKLKSVEDSERSSADSRSGKDRREGNTNLTVPSLISERLMKMHGVKAVTISVVLHTYKINGKEVFG
jgi:hypothetical protein